MTDGPQRALDKVVSVFSFVDPCRKLITVYKDKKELRLAEVLAEMLANYKILRGSCLEKPHLWQSLRASRHFASAGLII